MSAIWNKIGRVSRNLKSELQRFGAPLKEQFGIDIYWTYILTAEGYFGYLGNQPEIAASFMHEKLYIGHPHFRHPRFFSPGLWVEGVEVGTDYQMTQKIMSEKKLMQSVFLILEKKGEDLIGFGFSSSCGEMKKPMCFTNGAYLLQRFMLLFREYFKNEIIEAFSDKVQIVDEIGGYWNQPPDMNQPSVKEEISFYLSLEYNSLRREALQNFTRRERQCIEGLFEGLTADEIGKRLHLSRRTIESHFNSVKARCGCNKKSELLEFLSPWKNSVFFTDSIN